MHLLSTIHIVYIKKKYKFSKRYKLKKGRAHTKLPSGDFFENRMNNNIIAIAFEKILFTLICI